MRAVVITIARPAIITVTVVGQHLAASRKASTVRGPRIMVELSTFKTAPLRALLERLQFVPGNRAIEQPWTGTATALRVNELPLKQRGGANETDCSWGSCPCCSLGWWMVLPWAPTAGRSVDGEGAGARKSGPSAGETAFDPKFTQPRINDRGSCQPNAGLRVVHRSRLRMLLEL